MFAKFSRSWELVKASAGVLRSDKELLVFPVVSGIAALIVMATFALPIFALKIFSDGFGVLQGLVVFLFYLCQYFVIFYFNSALVGAAMIRLNGGDPTVRDGLQIANERLVPILGYAAIAATVGLLLQFLKNKDNNFIVRMLGSLLGTAWTVASFLVVPVLVTMYAAIGSQPVGSPVRAMVLTAPPPVRSPCTIDWLTYRRTTCWFAGIVSVAPARSRGPFTSRVPAVVTVPADTVRPAGMVMRPVDWSYLTASTKTPALS